MRAKFAEIGAAVPTMVTITYWKRDGGGVHSMLEPIELIPGSVLEVFVTSPPDTRLGDDTRPGVADWMPQP